MNPFTYDFESTYLEQVERQARIARAEEASRLLRHTGHLVKAAVHTVARLLRPAGDPAGRHAA